MTDGTYELHTAKRCLTSKIKVHGCKTCRFLPADFSEFSENKFYLKKKLSSVKMHQKDDLIRNTNLGCSVICKTFNTNLGVIGSNLAFKLSVCDYLH